MEKKTLTIGSKKFILYSGDVVAIPAGTTCDVKNETNQGIFESTWIVFSESSILNALKHFSRSKKLMDPVPLKNCGKELEETYNSAVKSIIDASKIPVEIAQIRILELLGWLSLKGYVFNHNDLIKLSHRVRLLIGTDPRAKWLSKDVAKSLAMSEATLRRKLAEESQSFNECLIDVRMSTALTLLQVTDLSIGEIAYEVGYESASRFSVRFKKRFGFTPNTIRKDHEY